MTRVSTDPLAQAILRTLAYADLFDYALTSGEIHQYLIGYAATRTQVEAALGDYSRLDGEVGRPQGFFTLPQRESLVMLREARRTRAAPLWNRARRYARILAHLPFVRMVAVTGALAVDNPRERDDIDFLIITAPGHLWTVRGLIVTLVHLARRLGDELCPNYLITENALAFDEQNLYTAHEIMQLIPLYGIQTYHSYLAANRWAEDYLPNARQARLGATEQPLRPLGRAFKRWSEQMLSTRVGARLEKWEQRRKIAKLCAQIPTGADRSNFTADCCKGHFEGHARRALSEYEKRWELIQA